MTSSLTTDEYAAVLSTAGLTGIELRRTHQVAGKLDAAIVHAIKPLQLRDNRARIAVMTEEHAEQVLAVYQAGLDTGDASFETTAPDWGTWARAHLPTHRFVALDPAGAVVGWVAASPVSSRCVYARVLEHSVYIRPDQQGHGIGRALLDTYVAATEAAGVWTLQSRVFPENTASLTLHERAGFRAVGRRERIGHHYGVWRDVTLIERRSTAAGL